MTYIITFEFLKMIGFFFNVKIQPPPNPIVAPPYKNPGDND